MDFLRDQGEFASVVRIANEFKSTMEKANRQSLLGRAELAAVIADLAGSHYDTVEAAAAAISARGGSPYQSTAFKEMMQVSVAARQLIDEALALDPGCLLAVQLAKAIEARARKADLSKLPSDLGLPGTPKKLK